MTKDVVPVAALDQHIGIFGSTGSGKSYTARFLLESVNLANPKTPKVIIDPKGDWWGVRLLADGKTAGMPFLIVGGPHADEGLQLPENHPEDMAEPLAKMIVTSSDSLILDLSELPPSSMRRFVAAFTQALYHNARQAMFLVVDEADEFAPQKAVGDATHCLSAMARLAKRGRGRGIRLWTISQRPASINTDVRGQMQAVCAMKLTLPHDIKAVREWMQAFNPETAAKLAASFPTLRGGKQARTTGRGAEGWFWSPEHGDPAKVEWPKVSTFDSMRTPEHGENRSGIQPAPIDTKALRTALADHVRAKEENEPSRLKARIAEIEERLAAAGTHQEPAPCTQCAKVLTELEAARMKIRCQNVAIETWSEKLTSTAMDMDGLVRASNREEASGGRLADDDSYEFITGKPAPWKAGNNSNREEVSHDEVDGEQNVRGVRFMPADRPVHDRGVARAGLSPDQRREANVRRVGLERASQDSAPVERHAGSRSGQSVSGVLGKGEAAVLTAIAQHAHGVSREQLSVLTGYKRSSRDTYLQRLRSAGMIHDGEPIRATAEGVAALGPSFQPLPTGRRLREHWLKRLPEGERRVLEAILSLGGRAIDRDQITNLTDYKRSSRDTYLQRLSSRKLIEAAGPGQVRPSASLFDASERRAG